MIVEPVVLEGDFVKLEPMESEHVDALWEAGKNPAIWQWTLANITSREDMKRYVDKALEEFRRGDSLPFVTREASTQKIVGSTRFAFIDSVNRSVEIGYTWINPEWQRTLVNTEAKLLMLMHAFEVWKCVRVQLVTDVLNEKSRNAIQRIGAKQEGILRDHLITETGRLRDTVFFSIIESEWPQSRAALEEKLRRYK